MSPLRPFDSNRAHSSGTVVASTEADASCTTKSSSMLGLEISGSHIHKRACVESNSTDKRKMSTKYLSSRTSGSRHRASQRPCDEEHQPSKQQQHDQLQNPNHHGKPVKPSSGIQTPHHSAATVTHHRSVAAAASLWGNNGSKNPNLELPTDALAAAAAAMLAAPDEVRKARDQLKEKEYELHKQHGQHPRYQSRRLLDTQFSPALEQRTGTVTRCRLDEGSYYTFKSAKVNGATVEFKNREQAAASIHHLHCEYGIPVCRKFGFRYFVLAEQNPQHPKAGSVIRKPLSNKNQDPDELHKHEPERKHSKNDAQVRADTAALRSSPLKSKNSSRNASLRWSYCIRIRVRQLQRPQELLQLSTQLGVFFHELAHLRYMNHGLRFACLLASIFRFATERGLFEPGLETELPSPWLWERVVFFCGGFVSDEVIRKLLLADPKARSAAACDLTAVTASAATEGGGSQSQPADASNIGHTTLLERSHAAASFTSDFVFSTAATATEATVASATALRTGASAIVPFAAASPAAKPKKYQAAFTIRGGEGVPGEALCMRQQRKQQERCLASAEAWDSSSPGVGIIDNRTASQTDTSSASTGRILHRRLSAPGALTRSKASISQQRLQSQQRQLLQTLKSRDTSETVARRRRDIGNTPGIYQPRSRVSQQRKRSNGIANLLSK
ncbi:uncharacterized protein LOC34618140 [Cyclospora cayetanensis]|uniref:Uncharacterized protein LOC34618140 n=1 Tax=Cyclospora cayetanensis TaxID=88456 RepID=A0A6P6RY82_9EIME|nr:uncharacterized protein LOC34618140 [Cyclospora cayetanensis]